MAKKKPKKRKKPRARRIFHAAKIRGHYQTRIKELREITLKGLPEKTQLLYVDGIIRKQMQAALQKSTSGRITCSYKYYFLSSGKSSAIWNAPATLGSEYAINLFLVDCVRDLRNSFALAVSNGEPEEGGLHVFRINSAK